MRNIIKFFGESVVAGMCIAFGGGVFLAVDNKIIGAMLFSVALVCICASKLPLYTGQIGYLIDKKYSLLHYLLMLDGNLLGAWIGSFLIVGANIYNDDYLSKARHLAEQKANKNWLVLLIAAIGCGAIMYIIVEAYRETKSFIPIVLGVTCFILVGFEHSIADYVYWMLGTLPINTVWRIFIIILGNTLGSLGTRACRLNQQNN